MLLFLCLMSISATISRPIGVAANGNTSFFVMSEYYFLVPMYCSFSIRFSVVRQLSCCQVLALVNSAAMTLGYNTRVLLDNVFLLIYAQEWDCRIISQLYF